MIRNMMKTILIQIYHNLVGRDNFNITFFSAFFFAHLDFINVNNHAYVSDNKDETVTTQLELSYRQGKVVSK